MRALLVVATAGLMILGACARQSGTTVEVPPGGARLPYTVTSMRWRFVDGANMHEIQEKERTIRRIDAFWRDFQTNANKFVYDPQYTVSWMDKNLKTIDRDFVWEITRVGKNVYGFTITPESEVALRPIVHTMIQRCPNMPGWRFFEYKQPLPASVVANGFRSKTKRNLPGFSAGCKASAINTVDVTIAFDGFSGKDKTRYEEDAKLLCELVLGEENVDKWIGQITVTPLRTAGRLDAAQSSAKFVSDYVEQKKTIARRLPSRPYWVIKDERYWLSTNTKGGKPRKEVDLSAWLKSFANAAASSKNFYSERYSKCSEKFCCLRAKEVGERVALNNREAIESSIDVVLRQFKIGCVMGAAPQSSDTLFIDLAIVDVDQAIPRLREAWKQLNLPHDCYLGFYDADWSHEWVGMANDTPHPKELIEAE